MSVDLVQVQLAAEFQAVLSQMRENASLVS